VRLLLAKELDDRFATCAKRVTSIENVNDNIGRVEHLVELSPNTTGRSLGIDWLTSERNGRVVSLRSERLARHIGSRYGSSGSLAKLFNASKVKLGALTLSLLAEGVTEGLSLDNVRALAVTVLALILEQAHRELVTAEKDRVRVGNLLAQCRTEVVKRSLRDDTSVA
jgi:hypothetical protein